MYFIIAIIVISGSVMVQQSNQAILQMQDDPLQSNAVQEIAHQQTVSISESSAKVFKIPKLKKSNVDESAISAKNPHGSQFG